MMNDEYLNDESNKAFIIQHFLSKHKPISVENDKSSCEIVN